MNFYKPIKSNKPIKLDKTNSFGEPLWQVTLDFRCPSCKKIFKSTSTASSPAKAIALPKDKDGYPELACNTECYIEHLERSGRKDEAKNMKESLKEFTKKRLIEKNIKNRNKDSLR